MKLFLCIFIFSSTIIFAQTDWQKWGKANYSYAVKDNFHRRDLSFDAKNPARFVLKSLLDSYWFFISDVDGDNCAFSPSCSNFFLQSVSKTNLVQGTLMFFDRFTRDMDFISKFDFYPSVPDGHFYDPISLYTLDKNEIKYIPPSVIVNNE